MYFVGKRYSDILTVTIFFYSTNYSVTNRKKCPAILCIIVQNLEEIGRISNLP